jgi:hypothetical protein
LLLSLWSDFAPRVWAQGGVPLWTNRYVGPGNGDHKPFSIAADSSGNVFVTGSSAALNSLPDYATIKYSSVGEPLWTNRYNGPGNTSDQPSAVAVGGNGNVFVAGRSEDINGRTDYATLAYSNTGTPLWTNRFNGVANQSDSAVAVAVDNFNNVIVTGSSFGTNTHFDFATIKYSNAGAPLWTNQYIGPASPGPDFANALAVDQNGNVFVAGTVATTIPPDYADYLTVSYASSGTARWTNRYEGEFAYAVKVDSSSNVVTAGLTSLGGVSLAVIIKYSNTGIPMWTNVQAATSIGNSIAMTLDGAGRIFVTSFTTNNSGGNDRITVALSATGAALWTNRFEGPTDFFDRGNAIAVDVAGNVFVTGSATNGNNNHDFATVAYSNTGAPLWTNRFNGPANGQDVGYALAVDSSGNVFVTGRSTAGNGNFDFITIKYSSSIPAIRLNSQRLNNQLVISWTEVGFSLQSAPLLSGTFTNIPGATSPHTNSISGTQRFFRLKKD